MTNIFKPDYQNFEGVRPISIYVLRLFFVLMFAMMGYTAWTHFLTHKGEGDPINAVTWYTWATYSALSLFGIYNTLKNATHYVVYGFVQGTLAYCSCISIMEN